MSRLGQHRPRLVVVDEIALVAPWDPYLTLKALATYSSRSVRWLRARLTDPVRPLPCYRIEGKILVRRSDFDAWMLQYRQVGSPLVNQLVTELVGAV